MVLLIDFHIFPRRAASRGGLDPVNAARKEVTSHATARTGVIVESRDPAHSELTIPRPIGGIRDPVTSPRFRRPGLRRAAPRVTTAARGHAPDPSARDGMKPFLQTRSFRHLGAATRWIHQAHGLIPVPSGLDTGDQ